MSDVESGSGRTKEFFDTKEAILASVPERCQRCIKPRKEARNLAAVVNAGEISQEDAEQSLATDIGQHCLLGPAYTGNGCRPQPSYECGYGGRDLSDEERLELALCIGGGVPLDLLPPEARVAAILSNPEGADPPC